MKHYIITLLIILFFQSFLSAVEKRYYNNSNTDYAFEVVSNYDINYYKIDLEFEDSSSYIKGATQFNFTWIEGDTLKAFLSDKLQVKYVLLNLDTVLFNHSNNAIIIPVSYLPGTKAKLSVAYEGDGQFTPSRGGVIHSFNYFGKPIVFTLSEPFAASSWFPTNNNLRDKIDSSSVWATVSSYMKAGSNGLLEGVDTLTNDKVCYKWKTNYPQAFYLISVAIGDYFDYTTKTYIPHANDSLLFVNYIYKDFNIDDVKQQVDCTTALIDAFSDLFGPYPFIKEKYGHCMAPIGGGMEHQTMTTLSDLGFNLIAHELAHQWFGDNVTCSTWKDIWVNEGFATYSEYLALEYFNDTTGTRNWLVDAMALAKEAEGSIYLSDDEADNVNDIFNYYKTYQKGAIIIHMLRNEINNDELFFKVLKSYQQSYQDGVSGVLDFKDIVEEITGKSFEVFFNQWLFSSGYPEFNIIWEQVKNKLTIISEQSTVNNFKSKVFQMPIEFRLEFSNGDSLVTLQQMHTIDTFEIALNQHVKHVIVNPNLKMLLDVNHTKEINGLFSGDTMFVIYPNPVNDNLTIQSKEENITFTAEIYDLSGKKLMKIPKSNYIKNVNISHLADGVYNLVLNSDKVVSNFTFIKN